MIKIRFFVKKLHKLVLVWRSAHCTQWKSGLGVCYSALQTRHNSDQKTWNLS